MKIEIAQLKSKFLGFVLLILTNNVISAQDNFALPGREDSASVTIKTSQHSLYAGLGSGSNMVYMGAGVSQNKPFYSATLTYAYNNELYASASAYHLSAFDPFLAFNTFSLGYNHGFNSWLDISAGISRYQVSDKLTDTLFNHFFYGDLAIGFDWKILYTNLSAGSVFSGTSSAYLQLRNSRYFQTPAFYKKKAFFSFDPYLNMLFGTLTKMVTSEGTTTGISSPFRPAGNSAGNNTGSNSSETISKVFSLMEIDFGLPVSFNIGKFTVEAEPGYLFPMYSQTDILYTEGFTFLLSFYFRIF